MHNQGISDNNHRGGKMNRFKFASLALAASLAFGTLAGAMAQDAEKVVLRTDYRYNGYIAPFALALERGYYKEAGIEVSIEQGQGSGTTIQTVASGADTFGMADSATAVLGISAQNIPVKLLSVYTQTATMGLIYHPDSDFTGDLATLKGKVVISSAGAADLRLLDPALASVGLKQSDVQIQLVEPNARVPLFLQTPGAFLTGFATGDLLRVRSKLPDAKYVPYAEYGVIAYGTGLIASDTTIAEKPELVKKFVAASRKGWEDALKDPEAAVAASLKLYPDLDQKLLIDGLKIALEQQLHTPATKGHPIGWTDEGDWTKMIEVLKQYAGLAPKELSAYYTNAFIGD
jgi:NitT/TauT family transport system substrate-binding protein